MQPLLDWAGSPQVRRLFNLFSVGLALIVGALVARHFAENGWPIHQANMKLVGIAGGLFLLSYCFKAFGWQRLFHSSSRPQVLTLAAAGGCAAVGGQTQCSQCAGSWPFAGAVGSNVCRP
jgi:hypothetical protein